MMPAMTTRDFMYWLQGYFDGLLTCGRDGVGEEATAEIRSIVASHFQHVIDPQDGDSAKQDALNKIHSGGRPPQPPSNVAYRC